LLVSDADLLDDYLWTRIQGTTPDAVHSRWAIELSHLLEFRERVRNEGATYAVLSSRALLALFGNDLPKARTLLERLVALHPDIPYSILMLGDVELRQGDLPRGLTHLSAVRMLPSDALGSHNKLCHIYLDLGMPRDAWEVCSELARQNPTYVRSRIYAAAALVDLHRPREALAILDSIPIDHRDHNRYVTLQMVRSSTLGLLSRCDTLAELLEVVSGEYASDPLVDWIRHEDDACHGRFGAAALRLRSILDGSELVSSKEIVRLAELDFAAGSVERARATFEACIRLQQRHARCWFGLAKTQSALNDIKGAQASLEKVVALDEDDVEAHRMLGDMLAKTGEIAGAERQFAAMRAAEKRLTIPLSLN